MNMKFRISNEDHELMCQFFGDDFRKFNFQTILDQLQELESLGENIDEAYRRVKIAIDATLRLAKNQGKNERKDTSEVLAAVRHLKKGLKEQKEKRRGSMRSLQSFSAAFEIVNGSPLTKFSNN